MKAVRPTEFVRVIVEATVQDKAVAYPAYRTTELWQSFLQLLLHASRFSLLISRCFGSTPPLSAMLSSASLEMVRAVAGIVWDCNVADRGSDDAEQELVSR